MMSSTKTPTAVEEEIIENLHDLKPLCQPIIDYLNKYSEMKVSVVIEKDKFVIVHDSIRYSLIIKEEE